MQRRKKSAAKRIVQLLKRYERIETNTSMAKALKLSPALVSSVTNRLCKAGKISRYKYDGGEGPWLYYIDTRFEQK